MKGGVFASLAVLSASGACFGATLTEDFPDPLGGYLSRWLGQNSNLGSIFGNCDPDERGNNPTGIWIYDDQACGGGGNGNDTCDIIFDPLFAPQLQQISFGIESFIQQTVRFYDAFGVEFYSESVSGGNFPLDHTLIVDSGFSPTGISRIWFSGSGAEGNTSIDNVVMSFEGCYSDCDLNQSLDLFDFLCFVNEFNAGEDYADCDANGALDLFDFLCFVNEFNAGC